MDKINISPGVYTLIGVIVGFLLNIIKDFIHQKKEDKKIIRSIELIKSDIQSENDFIDIQLPDGDEWKDNIDRVLLVKEIEEPVDKIIKLVNELKQRIMLLDSTKKSDKYIKEYTLLNNHFILWRELVKETDTSEITFDFKVLILAIKDSSNNLRNTFKII